MMNALHAGSLSPLPENQSLHVLTLTPFYPSEQDDGRGCFVADPLAALTGHGIANTIVAAQPFYRPSERSHPAVQPAEGMRYFSVPGNAGLSLAGAFLFARMVPRIRQRHRARKIDLIHAHAPLPCGHAAMLLSRELGVPYVVSVHGLDAFSTVQVRGRSGEWCRRISQRVYRSATRVICISERVREQVLEGVGGACRTVVIYNAVDPAQFAPASAAPDSPMILSIGNLIPIKGHELLVRAAASLAPEFPSLRWEVIGDGPERAGLEALASELQVSDRVRFLGRQSRAQVADALRRCTVFVLASRYEGLGCVYLEAMSTAKPVIGCKGQGIAEVIRHGWNGLLVGSDDEKELALAISMLLRDEPGRRQMGIAARATIMDRFTLTHQAENLARVYRECVV